MGNISAANIKEEIERLEKLKAQQELSIKLSLKETKDSLRPINLVKSLFQETKKEVKTPEVKTSLITSGMSLATGIMARKLLIGKTRNKGIVKKLMGTTVEATAAGIMAKYAIYIQAWVSAIAEELFIKDDKEHIEDVTY